MRHVIVECLVEIFAPLCNPSFLLLVLCVRPVKCGKLRLRGLCCGVSLLVMVNSRIGRDCPPMPSARRAVRARSGHKLTISPTVAIQFWRCGSRHRIARSRLRILIGKPTLFFQFFGEVHALNLKTFPNARTFPITAVSRAVGFCPCVHIAPLETPPGGQGDDMLSEFGD